MPDTPTSPEAKSPLDTLNVNAGTPAKPAIYNQTILDDMQKLYEQKQAEKNYFLQDLADASAWWSGGAAGPSAGLAQRAQTRAAQSKQLEDLQAQIMQGKVNLSQLGEANEALKPGAQALSGMPTNQVGSAGTQFSASGEKLVPYRGTMIPEKVYRVIQTYINGGNKAKADEEFAKYVGEETKFTTNPSTYKQDEYWDEAAGKMERRNPAQIRSGAAPMAAPTAQPSAVAPTIQTTPATFKPTGGEDVYRFENLSDSAKQRLSNDSRTQLGLINNVMDRPDVAQLFNQAPLEQRKAAFMKPSEQPVISQTTPVSAPTTATASTPVKSYSQYQSEQAGAKQYAESAGKASGEEAGKRQAALEGARVDLGTKMNQAQTVLQILDQMPEAVGLRYRNRATGLIMEGAEAGALPFVGKKNLEGVVASQLPRDVRIAREKFDSVATNLAADYRREAAKGTGQVSDYETKMFQKASGLNKEDPAEANKYFAILRAESLRSKGLMLDAWDKYQQTHSNASFAKFEREDPRYKEIINENEARLKKHFPEVGEKEGGFGEPANKVNKSRIDELEKIYGGKK
jgi:hypothetical protein